DYPGDRKLRCAVNDAQELASTFKTKSQAIFDVHTKVLPDNRATSQAIFNELDVLKNSMQPQDMAVIFYAGHAERDGNGRVLLLLDACHSGAIGKLVNDLARDLADDDCGVVVLCAALGREQARENPATKHGYFCLALIEGLSGKAGMNKQDGRVYLHHLE